MKTNNQRAHQIKENANSHKQDKVAENGPPSLDQVCLTQEEPKIPFKISEVS
jgi:hypothetical protein